MSISALKVKLNYSLFHRGLGLWNRWSPKPLNTSYHFTGTFLRVFLKIKGITEKRIYNVLLNTHIYKNVCICISMSAYVSLYFNFKISEDFKFLLLNQSLNFWEKIFFTTQSFSFRPSKSLPIPTKHLKSEKKSQMTLF